MTSESMIVEDWTTPSRERVVFYKKTQTRSPFHSILPFLFPPGLTFSVKFSLVGTILVFTVV